MTRRRGRPLKGFDDGSSSSEDDDNDAFAAISKKNNSKRLRVASFGGGDDKAPESSSGGSDGDGNKNSHGNGRDSDNLQSTLTSSNPAVAETSSIKRHHHMNAARQAKMNALLQELQSTAPSDPSTASGSGAGGDVDYGTLNDGMSYYYPSNNPPPLKMGSYVEPGQEHLTTNIFVGNLDPMTTEEELTDAFRQFGEIVWLFLSLFVWRALILCSLINPVVPLNDHGKLSLIQMSFEKWNQNEMKQVSDFIIL